MYLEMVLFMIKRNRVYIQNDVAIIEEVEGFVTEFRDTWKEVIRINRQQQFGQGNSGQI